MQTRHSKQMQINRISFSTTTAEKCGNPRSEGSS